MIGTSSCPDANITPSPAVFKRVAAATSCLVNAERSKVGLPGLRLNRPLNVASKRMARRMARQHFLGHFTPDGAGPFARVRAAGYSNPDVVGENLGFGTGALATPAAMVVGWMQSPGHRRNILDGEFRDVGIGIAGGSLAAGGGRGTYYVTDFGRR